MLSVINQHTSNHETSVTASGRVYGIYLYLFSVHENCHFCTRNLTFLHCNFCRLWGHDRVFVYMVVASLGLVNSCTQGHRHPPVEQALFRRQNVALTTLS